MPTRAFYHYSNEPLTELEPRHGAQRHAGEAKNAVGQEVVYLFDRPTPSVQVHGAAPKYEHRVEIDDGDELLEQEDPQWAPTVWIYRAKLQVCERKTWNESAQSYE